VGSYPAKRLLLEEIQLKNREFSLLKSTFWGQKVGFKEFAPCSWCWEYSGVRLGLLVLLGVIYSIFYINLKSSSRVKSQSRRIFVINPGPIVSPECTGTTVHLPSECFKK